MKHPDPSIAPSITVVGCGAAGLFAAIFAARGLADNIREHPVLALDGAPKLGAKILVAGGGRCNVTHHAVSDLDFATSGSHNTIRRILRAFTVNDTIEFFREQGVTLKREDTGKLFPTTDRARTVLDALLTATRNAGAQIIHPHRVHTITFNNDRFTLRAPDDARPPISARRVILCAGGQSLPRTGSDGRGYVIARALGHSTTKRIFPALVPLKADPAHTFVHALQGLAAPATAEVRAASNKRLASFTGPVLCTHFGLSGPAILDISRFLLDARADDPGAHLVLNWLPAFTFESLDAALADLGKRTPLAFLRDHLPERLARALIDHARIDPATTGASLKRDDRRVLARAACECEIPVTDSRGYSFAEVTAGGVPLDEIDPATMESRITPGLHLAGEILDCDGRIGGFNFQWAWATGYIAGSAAAAALLRPDQ